MYSVLLEKVFGTLGVDSGYLCFPFNSREVCGFALR